jgi:hypothetical protein
MRFKKRKRSIYPVQDKGLRNTTGATQRSALVLTEELSKIRNDQAIHADTGGWLTVDRAAKESSVSQTVFPATARLTGKALLIACRARSKALESSFPKSAR